jgi:hypothetical protein
MMRRYAGRLLRAAQLSHAKRKKYFGVPQLNGLALGSAQGHDLNSTGRVNINFRGASAPAGTGMNCLLWIATEGLI